MRVDIVHLPGMRLAGVRHDGPNEQISTAFEQLSTKAGELGPPKAPDAQWVAVHAAEPDAAGGQPQSFATVSVAEDADIGDLEEVRIPPGTYARTEHVGPRAGLATAWKVFGNRLSDAGHHVRKDQASFEIYPNLDKDAPEDQLRTELYLPLR
jgi:AraC family transcriptional regulator